MAHHYYANSRRFSYGGAISEFEDAAVWKFDVHIHGGGLHESQITAYVKYANRGDAFRALFSKYPGAKILGTGLPLTDEAALNELGRIISAGEVQLVGDDKPAIETPNVLA